MVVMPKQNVPALRLEGFSGEWETGLAREIFVETDDRGYPGLPVLSATQTSGMVPRSMMDYAIQHNRENEVGYKRVCVGDFVVHLRSFQGGFAHSYYEGITSPAYHVFRARERSHQDDRFWRFVFSSSRFIHQLHFVTFGIRDGKSISFPEFLELSLRYAPTLDEQQAIGAIFTNLDAAINQHTLKHKALQQSKTALMQRMFPQEGQTAPELRLEGFDGEWEEKRLVDEVSFFSGLTYTPSDVVEHDGTLVLRSSNVQDGVIATKDCVYVRTDAVNVQNVRKNDIIMVVRNGSRSLIGKHAVVQKPMPSTVIGAFMTGIRSDQPWFINALFDTGLFKYEVDKSMGATINQITGGMFAGMSFFFPPTLEEQQAIGAIFTKLDALIAAEAQYIKSLSQAKTALLQRMFI